jgi:hypothetical protein
MHVIEKKTLRVESTRLLALLVYRFALSHTFFTYRCKFWGESGPKSCSRSAPGKNQIKMNRV